MNSNVSLELANELTSTLKSATQSAVDAHRRLDCLERTQAEIKAVLRHGGGVPGAANTAGSVGREDVEKLGTFMKTCYGVKTGNPVADVMKVAADLTIVTDARGGYLVPTHISPTVDALVRPEGSFLAACDYTTVEPGVTYRFPSFSTAPAAAWRLTEGGATTEYDVAVGSLERKPFFVGGFLDISHELWYQSDHNVGNTLAVESINAVRQKVETALIAGEDGGTDPYDGIGVVAGTNAQTALATPTVALLSTFIGESLVDYPGLWNTGALIMSPAVAEIIREDSCSTAYTSRVTYTSAGGMLFDKWPVHVTPAIGNAQVIMCEPAKVKVVNFGWTVQLDPNTGLKNLMVTALFGGWFGYGCTLPASVSKAAITALA